MIKWKYNEKSRSAHMKVPTDILSTAEVNKAWDFHKSFANYEPTPLRSLSNLAKRLGVGGIFVKDEAYRFGLNAFKVLGGAYAMGRYLAERLETPMEELPFEKLKSPEIKEKLGDITFTSATDGNHGRGVAWAAQQMGQKAVIYMPKGSSLIRLENIKATGAEGYITEFNYDDAVRLALHQAEKYGWILVQDTAWEGYEDIPTWIMQGYATMAAEAMDQLIDQGVDKPTHIFVQAGVGSLAGSMQGFFAARFQEDRPVSVIVEPDKADCIFRSALAGELRVVNGDMNTIMAGLACGEPNPIGWNILRDYSDMFISCPDNVAAKGMRILGNPLGDDMRVISGESGAVTTGILSIIMENENMKEARELLKLDKDSKILVFNTEGDTDSENYRSIVWDGLYPSVDREGVEKC